MVKTVEDDSGSIGGAGTPISGSTGSENPNYAGKNLREGSNVTIRPKVLTSAHLYNLRNQGWSLPRLVWTGDRTTDDPITLFWNESNKSFFPSNSDTVAPALYANTASSYDKTVERFNTTQAVGNPLGTALAANGYFVIDALARGQSRLDNLTNIYNQYSSVLDWSISTLPQDYTPGGATVVCEFAGRIWYAGFSGQIVDGDQNSPRMSSYVLFSQIVTDQSSITSCYQVADPTNKDDSALVESDGGLIRIEGAYGIVGLANIGKYLAVIAANGVWLITGGNNSGFKATDYKVDKVTNFGCISPGSIVVVNDSLFYWGADGIYNLAPNQFGDYSSTNITEKTIQTFFEEIDSVDIISAEGVYDSYEKKIKWLYGNRTGSTTPVKELQLDLVLRAFYPFTHGQVSGNKYPMAVKGVITNPFSQNNSTQNVTVNGTQVTVSGVNVTTIQGSNSLENNVKEVKYLIITQVTPTIAYSFGTYNVSNHYDYKSIDSVGVDAKSYLITGTLSGGDFQRKKDLSYLTVYCRKTEDGFTVDDIQEWIPNNQSSCLVRTMWDWSDDPISGKWSRQQEFYRFNRKWFPTTTTDFNNGYFVVSHRDKIRGSGNVLSVKIESNPGYHMELLGWSMIVMNNNDV